MMEISHISKEELHNLIEGSSIEYLGFSNNVSMELSKTKSIVLPSYREGLSRVLIEAASMKCVLLASDVPGCRQVVSKSNGYLFESKSVSSLVKSMQEFIDLDKNEIDEMATRSRELAVERFSTQVINKQVIECLC